MYIDTCVSVILLLKITINLHSSIEIQNKHYLSCSFLCETKILYFLNQPKYIKYTFANSQSQ